MVSPSPKEVVGLGQTAQYPVIPHDNYPGSKVSLLLGEGVLQGAAPCPPLQSRPSASSHPYISSSSCEAGVVLQGVLHQHHTAFHRWFHLDASAP